ncbi:MAG: sacsin N-terminal ATP-binding-like domain-containing protein, partial [Trebonia sp.]
MPDDPFNTAALRRSVLDAWAASPARFREDANAEEDYALGGYRDRVVVELAQNAADAATRAGVPGRLRLALRDGVLTAANTGAPLDAAGVAALSTLRASSKRDDSSVGRFGVGFAAAVAVSDEPSIASATGAVRWSRAATLEAVTQIPSLAAELGARSGQVPVLRLPFPTDTAPPDGFATEVTLPLRDAEAADLVARLLAEAGPALLLALPALAEITISLDGRTRRLTGSRDGDDVTITADGDASHWHTAAASGTLAPALLADRPAEERARPSWALQWAFETNNADCTSGGFG